MGDKKAHLRDSLDYMAPVASSILVVAMDIVVDLQRMVVDYTRVVRFLEEDLDIGVVLPRLAFGYKVIV